MEQATSLKSLRSISGVSSAESAPTTSSSWVNLTDVGGNHFGRARVIFGEPTLNNADNDITVTLWAREGDTIVALKSHGIDTATDLFDDLDLGTCPPSWSFYVTVTALSGTSPSISMETYVQRYTNDA